MLDRATRLCVASRMSGADEIRAAREARKWSQAQVAEAARPFVPAEDRAKLVQQVVDRVEKGRYSRYLVAIRQALDLPVGQPPTKLPPSNVEIDEDAPEFRRMAGRVRDVEELGHAVGGSEGDFSLNGEVIGRVPRPRALIGRDIFAVRVRNDSMTPRFKEGELVYVDRHREPVAGEDAIIEMHPEEEHHAGPAFIKELVSKNMQTVVVMQHNPRKNITFQRREVKRLYRVIPWNEVLGV